MLSLVTLAAAYGPENPAQAGYSYRHDAQKSDIGGVLQCVVRYGQSNKKA